MQIQSLQIGGFGILRGEFNFHPGLNIILAPNEAGKTTLSAAILGLLYGTRQATGKRRLMTEDEKRYRPMTGGEFSLGGVVRTGNGRRYNIWRDFGGDICRVLELETGRDVSADFQRAPNGDILGHKLLGLSRMQYEKLAFLRQDELNNAWDFSEFSDALSTLFSSEDGEGSTVQQALDTLEQARQKYSGLTGRAAIKIDTEINRIERRLEEISRELVRLEAESARTENAFAEVAGRVERNEALGLEARRNEYLALLVRRTELERLSHERARARAEAQQLSIEMLELAQYEAHDCSAASRLAELAGLIRDRRTRETELARLEEGARMRLEVISAQIAEDEGHANAFDRQTDAQTLHQLEFDTEKLGELQHRAASARIDAQSAQSALKTAGLDAEIIRAGVLWIEQLPETERDFVQTFRSQEAELGAENSRTALRLTELERRKDEVERFRLEEYRQARTHLLLAMSFFVIAVLTFFLLNMLWFLALPPVLCVLWGIMGIVRMARAGNTEAAELERLIGEYREAAAQNAELEGRREEHVARLEKICATLPGGGAALLETLTLIDKAPRAVEVWRHTRQRLAELEEARQELSGRLEEEFKKRGLIWSGELDHDAARRNIRQLREHEQLRQRQEKGAQEMQELHRQREAILAETTAAEAEFVALLAAGGVEFAGDHAAALRVYQDNGRKRERFLLLREKELPAAIGRGGDENALAALQGDIDALRRRSEQMLAENPGFAGLAPEATVAEYEARAKTARERMRDDREMLQERERAMALELNRYRENVPALLREQEEMTAALKRAQSYRRAIDIAYEALEGVAADLHSRWSPLLSGELNDLVRRFSDRWIFWLSRELRLSVSPREGGSPLDEEGLALHLSSGTRDQVYLALRLLLARKIGRGQPLPLVLDDPFVNADDERFLQGMDYLHELSATHQVFVFSCHQARHAQLLANRAWYAGALVPCQSCGV